MTDARCPTATATAADFQTLLRRVEYCNICKKLLAKFGQGGEIVGPEAFSINYVRPYYDVYGQSWIKQRLSLTSHIADITGMVSMVMWRYWKLPPALSSCTPLLARSRI